MNREVTKRKAEKEERSFIQQLIYARDWPELQRYSREQTDKVPTLGFICWWEHLSESLDLGITHRQDHSPQMVKKESQG